MAGRRRVVVIGGGLAGLTAAYAVLRDAPQTHLTLVEAASRVGGKLRTERIGGLRIDVGADAFVVRRPEAVDLCAELGLDVEHPATSSAWVWARGKLRPLPEKTVLGVPTDMAALRASGVLSWGGNLSAAVEPWLRRSTVDDDIGIGRLVRSRFGHQVVDRLVDPLLGGVYAGRADDISAAAAAPEVFAAAREGSLLRHLLPSAADGPVFGGLSDGLAALPARLAERIVAAGGSVRTRVEATGLRPGWQVDTSEGPLPADAVVVATPAWHAAEMLDDVDLASIEHADVAIVTLVFPPVALPEGSGLLVPATEHRLVKAATFVSAKWAQRFGPDQVVVRASVGRAGEDVLERSDENLVAGVCADLADIAGIRVAPLESRVTRWPSALPQYAVGHLDRVARIESRVAAQQRLAVAGAAYHGVGIPAVIRSGLAAAQRIIDA